MIHGIEIAAIAIAWMVVDLGGGIAITGGLIWVVRKLRRRD